MDKVLGGLSFATTYVNDILVHSASEQEHKDHLRQVFQCLREAGLASKGMKVHTSKTHVSYLGHLFFGAVMCSFLNSSAMNLVSPASLLPARSGMYG